MRTARSRGEEQRRDGQYRALAMLRRGASSSPLVLRVQPALGNEWCAVEPAVMAAAFALVLGSSPEVWVETRGLPDAGGACSSDALATAPRAQRPGVVVHAWPPETDATAPPERALRLRLTQREDTVVLELTGAGTPIVRT